MSCVKIWICCELQEHSNILPCKHSWPEGRVKKMDTWLCMYSMCLVLACEHESANPNRKKSTEKWMRAGAHLNSKQKNGSKKEWQRKSNANTWMPSHFQLHLVWMCAHNSFQCVFVHLWCCCCCWWCVHSIHIKSSSSFKSQQQQQQTHSAWYLEWSTTKLHRACRM